MTQEYSAAKITAEEQETAVQTARESAERYTQIRYQIEHHNDDMYAMMDTANLKQVIWDYKDALEKKKRTLIKSAGTRAKNKMIRRIHLHNDDVRLGRYASLEEATRHKERILRYGLYSTFQ